MEVNKVIIYCKKCDDTYEIIFELVSDVLDIKCPKCKSENIWFRSFEFEDKGKEVKLGTNSGCSQK